MDATVIQAGLPRIGGLATMPSRIESCRQALPHILSQVDRLYVYLDQYDCVPDLFASDSRMVAILPASPAESLRGAGKFCGLSREAGDCLYFCFDDDIVYGAGYVEHMAAALRRHHYRAIVGIHGCVYRVPVASYTRDRQVLHFGKGLALDCHVDELGSGTMAMHSGLLRLDPWRWPHRNKIDLTLMIEGVARGIPRIAVRRSAGLLRPIAQNQADSLYRQSLADDSVETALLQQAMRSYPGRWCLSD